MACFQHGATMIDESLWNLQTLITFAEKSWRFDKFTQFLIAAIPNSLQGSNLVLWNCQHCRSSILFPVHGFSGSLNHSQERSRWAFTFSVSELRSVTVRKEGWTFLVFRLKDSSTLLPALHFHQGGSIEFLDTLRRFALLSKWVSYSSGTTITHARFRGPNQLN